MTTDETAAETWAQRAGPAPKSGAVGWQGLSEALARRNAEYTAKLEKSLRELDEGKGITMTFEEWGRRFCDD